MEAQALELLQPDPAVLQAQRRIGDALALLGKGSRSVREMRALILGLEAAMFAMPGHIKGEEFKATHHFEPGIYVRELFIPKGVTLTGKIHSHGHLNVLSQGKLTVWTEDGMKTLSASTVIRSQRGIKRVGYAHEDSVWITIHQNPTDERDISKVEARLFSDTFQEAYLKSGRSFDDAITFLGFTPDEVRMISENEADQVPFSGDAPVVILESPVHGRGVFAPRHFEPGEVIAPARIGVMRTPAGRYCNHSGAPNAEMRMRNDGSVDLIALRAIEPGEEILNDYFLDHERTRLCLVQQ